MILTIRTDKPEAELGLFDKDGKSLDYSVWHAHRELAETLHQKIADMLAGKQSTLSDIEGIVVFGGPGSFTGLRIGISVANALAYSLGCPVVASQTDDWIQEGITHLASRPTTYAVPTYDGPAFTTQPRK